MGETERERAIHGLRDYGFLVRQVPTDEVMKDDILVRFDDHAQGYVVIGMVILNDRYGTFLVHDPLRHGVALDYVTPLEFVWVMEIRTAHRNLIENTIRESVARHGENLIKRLLRAIATR